MTRSARSPRSDPVLSSVADLLGGIPADRIRLHPAPGTAREEDLLDIYAREKRRCELVDGVLVEKAMGFYESYLAGLLIHWINGFLDDNDLGIVAGEDGMVGLGKGLVRIPDVSFVRWERLPGRKIPRDPIPDLAPDLAVEVLSRSNTPGEMSRKREDFVAAGVRLVWFLDPETRTLEVYTSPSEKIVLGEEDTVDGGDVLPGFSVPIADFFRRAPQDES